MFLDCLSICLFIHFVIKVYFFIISSSSSIFWACLSCFIAGMKVSLLVLSVFDSPLSKHNKQPNRHCTSIWYSAATGLSPSAKFWYYYSISLDDTIHFWAAFFNVAKYLLGVEYPCTLLYLPTVVVWLFRSVIIDIWFCYIALPIDLSCPIFISIFMPFLSWNHWPSTLNKQFFRANN